MKSLAVEPWRYGGHRSGQRRKDGLISGTPEAYAADRAKDAARKRAARAAAQVGWQESGIYPAPATTKPARPARSGGFGILELAIMAAAAVFLGSFAMSPNLTRNQ